MALLQLPSYARADFIALDPSDYREHFVEGYPGPYLNGTVLSRHTHGASLALLLHENASSFHHGYLNGQTLAPPVRSFLLPPDGASDGARRLQTAPPRPCSDDPLPLASSATWTLRTLSTCTNTYAMCSLVAVYSHTGHYVPSLPAPHTGMGCSHRLPCTHTHTACTHTLPRTQPHTTDTSHGMHSSAGTVSCSCTLLGAYTCVVYSIAAMHAPSAGTRVHQGAGKGNHSIHTPY